jgi:MFS transporter, DHA3 family, macrolide efflux protein
MIGLPLFVARTLKGDVGALGLIIGAYGVGNVISNLVIGSIAYRRRVPMIFVGKIIVGLGFLLMASATSLPLAIVGSACAAVGGPMGDITILMMIQTEIPTASLGKVYSLRMLSENAGSSIGLLLAVPLFAHVLVMVGIMLCALVMIALGCAGLLRFGWKDPDAQRNRAIQYGELGS